MSRCANDRWSNYSTGNFQGSRYPTLRSKSPYRSSSSLSRASSNSNLDIRDDYFNALNKSLGAHDASFMEEQEVEDTGNQRYGSLQRPKSSSSRNRTSSGTRYGSKSTFDVDRLNKDYSRRYKPSNTSGNLTGSYGGNTTSGYKSTTNPYKSSYDYNNNDNDDDDYALTRTKIGTNYTGIYSDSEPEYDPYGSNPTGFKTKTTTRYTTETNPFDPDRETIKKTTTTKTTSSYYPSSTTTYKGLDYPSNVDLDFGDGIESDESMSEYLNCKSFQPDNLADSKIF